MSDPLFRCYLVASSGIDTRPIIRLMRDLQVDAGTAFDVDPPGIGVPTDLRSEIRKADFVCAIFSGSRPPSSNVALEVGVAIGLGKKLFIITDSREDLPWALSYFPQVVSDLRNLEPVSFHLGPFLASLKRPRKSSGRLRDIFSGKPKTITESVERISESQLTNQIAAALSNIGAEVVSEPQIGAAGRPDLLVWLSGASSSLGSPLVIEIKQTGANAPFESLAQIGRYMRALNARTGILAINQPGDLIQVSVVEGGFVFSLSPEHLLNLISSDKLLSQLIERRNAFAHGGN